MQHPERPHDNCYWLVPGSILAGEYPGDQLERTARRKLRELLAVGVTHFLDLTEERDGLEPYFHLLDEEAEAAGIAVAFRSMPLPDCSVPHSRAYLADVLDALDEAVEAGHCVYLHCWGGIGRTGLVAGCYLVRHGRSGEQALAELAGHWKTVAKRSRHPDTPQTPAQCDWVRTWEEVG